MGILDTLKKAAEEGLKTAVTSTTRAVATSSSKAMESVIAKTTAMVGSKLSDAVLKDLGGAQSANAAPAPNTAPSPNTASLPNTAPSPNTASLPNPSASAKATALVEAKAVPKVLSPAELETVIDTRELAKGLNSNWRYSIVDLMTAYDMNSSLDSRKKLAVRLNYYGYDEDGSAEKNTWLHAELLKALAQNGGEVPSNLL